MDWRAVDFRLKVSRDGQNGIPNFLGGEASHREPSEEDIFGIFGSVFGRGGCGALVCVGGHDQAMHRLMTAALFDECSGKPIQQFRV